MLKFTSSLVGGMAVAGMLALSAAPAAAGFFTASYDFGLADGVDVFSFEGTFDPYII